MNARALLFVMLATTSLGCDVLAPVVGTLASDVEVAATCDAPTCDAMDAPPPPPTHLAELRGPDDACAAGREPKRLTVTADAVIDADQLGCIDLEVEVVGEGTGLRVLTLAGRALVAARLHVHSASLPVELRVAVPRVDQSELGVDGPIDVLLTDVSTVASRIVLDGAAPLAAPRLVLDGGALNDVEILGEHGVVRLEHAQVRGAVVAVDSLVMDRGNVQESDLGAELIEMLDANLSASDLDVTHLVAASGVLRNVHVTRCGEITLSQLAVVSSYLAACDAPVDVRDVSIQSSVVLGDVVGTGGRLRDTVFGGARLSLAGGEVFSSALCGTQSVDVERIVCISCGSSAPADMCGAVSGPPELCPGLCASTCSTTGHPTLGGDACAS